jgi:hypothetical protein
MRPPSIKPLHPLLKDREPLLHCVPLPERHSLPRHAQSAQRPWISYHGPLSTSTVGVFVHAFSIRRMKREASRPSRVGVSATQSSSLFSVSTAAQMKYHRSFHLYFRLVNRYCWPVPLRWFTEQRLRPMVQLPHGFMGGLSENESASAVRRHDRPKYSSAIPNDRSLFGFRSRTKTLCASMSFVNCASIFRP